MTTLRALQCLVAVCDLGSVTKAAESLGITQPALSHQLATLQKDLGLDLVVRQAGGMRPTTAGRALLVQARVAVDAERVFTEQAQRVAGLHEGELRICCVQSVTAGLLPPVLRRWSQRRPDVTIVVSEHSSADVVADALVTHGCDLGISPRPTSWSGESTVLGWEEIVVAMASDDPLSVRRTVTLADVATRPLIQYQSDNGLAGWVDATFAADGLSPHVTVRTGQTGAVATLAASGVGVALVPLSAVPPHYRGAVRRLSPPQGRDVVALRTSESDALAAAFVADLARRGVPQLRARD